MVKWWSNDWNGGLNVVIESMGSFPYHGLPAIFIVLLVHDRCDDFTPSFLLIVPVAIVAPLIVGLVSVLFVSVSVVALPTRVSVAAGRVMVVVPATAVACNVVVPDVDPDRSIAFGLSVTVVAMIRPIKVCYSRRCWKAQ